MRKVRGRNGAISVPVSERENLRDVVANHIGAAHEEEYLAVLMKVADGRLPPWQDELDRISASTVGSGPG